MKQKPTTNLWMKESISTFIAESTAVLTTDHLPPQVKLMAMKALLFALLKEVERWDLNEAESLETYTRHLLLISRN
jgi:hypothetical protein